MKVIDFRGGSRIFSRGGGADFQKIFNQIDFPSSPKAVKRPCFGQIFCAAGNFLKKQVKKAVFGHFLENFDKKIGRPKMDFLKSTKVGTLWVGRGSNP